MTQQEHKKYIEEKERLKTILKNTITNFIINRRKDMDAWNLARKNLKNHYLSHYKLRQRLNEYNR